MLAVPVVVAIVLGVLYLEMPATKFPCGSCGKGVKINQPGVQCDVCDVWFHSKCLGLCI